MHLVTAMNAFICANFVITFSSSWPFFSHSILLMASLFPIFGFGFLQQSLLTSPLTEISTERKTFCILASSKLMLGFSILWTSCRFCLASMHLFRANFVITFSISWPFFSHSILLIASLFPIFGFGFVQQSLSTSPLTEISRERKVFRSFASSKLNVGLIILWTSWRFFLASMHSFWASVGGGPFVPSGTERDVSSCTSNGAAVAVANMARTTVAMTIFVSAISSWSLLLVVASVPPLG